MLLTLRRFCSIIFVELYETVLRPGFLKSPRCLCEYHIRPLTLGRAWIPWEEVGFGLLSFPREYNGFFCRGLPIGLHPLF